MTKKEDRFEDGEMGRQVQTRALPVPHGKSDGSSLSPCKGKALRYRPPGLLGREDEESVCPACRWGLSWSPPVPRGHPRTPRLLPGRENRHLHQVGHLTSTELGSENREPLPDAGLG